MFRGREITHADLGWKLLEKMMESLKGTVTIEKQPQMEGSRMYMILAPLSIQQPKATPAAAAEKKSKVEKTAEKPAEKPVEKIRTRVKEEKKEEKVKESANA